LSLRQKLHLIWTSLPRDALLRVDAQVLPYKMSRLWNYEMINVRLCRVSVFFNVIVTIWRGCTVLCFTRSPRWGTGYERDLKRDQKTKTKHHN